MDRIDAMRLFVRLAERRSFSAAARDLKIKQSTASKWIHELEAQVGVGLVERTTRSLHLTEAGQRFLGHATQVLAAYDELARDLGERSPEPSGRVRISVPVVFGTSFVLPAIAEFLRAHPKVSTEVVSNDRYVSLVEEGFDLAVRVGIPTDTSARGRKLWESRRVLVAAPSYLERHGAPRVPDDLRAHECLVHGDASAPAIWRFGEDATSVPVRGRFAANHSQSVFVMARSGFGIALLADWLVADDLASGRLVALLTEYPTLPAPIYALTPAGRFPSATVRALIDHLAEWLAARLPRGAPVAESERRD